MTTEEEIQLARERLTEVESRARELEHRPTALRQQLRDCEKQGDVEGADEAETELATFLGPAEAAKIRAEILQKIIRDAEIAIQRAAADAYAEQAAYNRRYGEPPPPSFAYQNECMARDEEIRQARERAAGPGPGVHFGDGTSLIRPPGF